MDGKRLTQIMFDTRGSSWKKSHGGQQLKELAVTGACRLSGWGPRDSPHQWLRTLREMA